MFFKHFLEETKNFSTADYSGIVEIPKDLLRRLLMAAIRSKTTVDEKYYMARYPDVARALAKGSIVSASDHWYETGFFENRTPRQILVDEEYYLKANPDVAKAVAAGKLVSCQVHFDQAGFSEGRAPFEGFSLF